MVVATKLRLITGLHVGSSDDVMKIGGIDSAVVKRKIYCDPESGEVIYDGKGKKITEPYIPGSSLKGKIRSLIEHSFGLVNEHRRLLDKQADKRIDEKAGKPIGTDFVKLAQKHKADELLIKKAKLVIALFGESAGSGDGSDIKITRAIFRDSFLSVVSRKLYLDDKISLSEEKAENTINRINVSANPRFLERVPSGVEFDFEVILREIKGDNTKLLKKVVEFGLKLLELDALGGGGSRGNGRIEFEKYDGKDKDLKEFVKEIEDELNNSED
jgi:CRISPR-associated protein Csm3